SSQRVGNFPGVTVEKKEGSLKNESGMVLVDLPGVYSLSPYSYEEIITRNFIMDGHTDAIINIVDATNLQRNLYLTLQLAELGLPMVIALNMMDDLERSGDMLRADVLEDLLGIPVVPISARTGAGVDRLARRAAHVCRGGIPPAIGDICAGPVHEAVHAISFLIEAKTTRRRYAAMGLFERDDSMRECLGLTAEELHVITEIVDMAEHKLGMESDAALADARYRFIERVAEQCLARRGPPDSPTLSNRIDDILTHRIWALPIFAAIIAAVFWITFGPVGSLPADGFARLLDALKDRASDALTSAGASEWTRGLLIDGVMAGIGAVLSFLPVILTLFLCLSLLEDSGYMARAAYVLDRPLKRLGLSGRSVIPMVIGFGCTVPAVMSSRTMQNEHDRRLTVFVTPFMSCGAKVPIYAMLTAALFSRYRALVFVAVYLTGVAAAVISAALLDRSGAFRGGVSQFIMELPPYRLPTPRTVLSLLGQKAADFIRRAFTLIFAGSMVIWFLRNFNFSLRIADAEHSMLAAIGGRLSWFFAPLGFGNWQSVTAILTGLTAKEAVVGTLAVVYGVTAEALPGTLAGRFSPASGLSFMVFNLLCMPCVAALAAIKRELGGWKLTLAAVGWQTGVAWVFAFLTYRLALAAAGLFGWF
ncbi:MAG: ferrous iron transport protein B, partial [Oscillospiraceae bacterium]|nr:ferrous iron transport protein B [Oscillospiraceae bacterium]